MRGPTSPTRLLLVRHGEVAGEGVLHGHVDVPLTGEGRAQIRRLAGRIAREPLAAVYCSDLSRARESARILAAGRDVPVVPDPAFRELHMGRWDGRALADILAEEPEGIQAWWDDLEGFRLPGGESLADLRARVLPALQRVILRHRGETVCLVAHGGVTRVILFDALGLSLARFHRVAQDYGCLNRIEYHPDGVVVVGLING